MMCNVCPIFYFHYLIWSFFSFLCRSIEFALLVLFILFLLFICFLMFYSIFYLFLGGLSLLWLSIEIKTVQLVKTYIQPAKIALSITITSLFVVLPHLRYDSLQYPA
jgi:hypothetical protein